MNVEHRITNARFWDQGKVGKSGTEESGNTPRRRTVNTFYDFVGQSPLKVWEAPDGEYGVLVTVSSFVAFSLTIRWPYLRKYFYRMIFLLQYEFQSQYLQLLPLIKAVRVMQPSTDYSNSSHLFMTAGIKYELNATVCIKGKKCVYSNARYL